MVVSVKPEYLRVLIAVESNGSLSAAAAELGITVSSVSYAVRQLEEQLGQALLNRDSYRVCLTPAGVTARDYAEQILNLHQSLEAHVRQVGEGWEPELRIAFTNMMCGEVLYQWLSEFYQLNSRTRIRVVREVYQGTWDALYDQRVDLVIGAVGQPPHEVDIEYLPAGRQSLMLVMAPDHQLATDNRPLSMGELSRYRLVDAGDSSRLIRPGKGQQQLCEDVLIVPDLFAQREAILSGIGVGFMPAHLISDLLASGALLSREIVNYDCSSELFVAWRKSSRGQALNWFRERLQAREMRARFLKPILTNRQEEGEER
ncbi:LysR substrate-binding domain-containing protein [Aliamphritea hakodatensis]|uniref:LysR substrate-binding domain-containing protein n=1 Tax=Aliamphritea hakodatensis TaxID=2895352 RepID=UPI0022FD78CF|nr:LysR substrate-binding domain-containing protein [Aliamphritea hakodatensis]